ncbi:hypothetical protein [Acidimangrovimonas pyrenivorans]|uniref:Ferrochelatase n=1 Tax=Acidimangrovimonas pyrenivorans TaxID=2030798 RepID=A0ABV7AMC6_9RHOB
MKKLALAAVFSATATATFAGGMAEPVMPAPVVVEKTTTSSGGIIIPLLLLVAVAAAASN